jgi:hypothetical protein
MGLDVLSGEETCWYENGQKQSHGFYSMGKRHGEWSFWRRDGVRVSCEEWKDGVEDGVKLIFDPVLKTISRVVYQSGQVIEPQQEVGVYEGGLDERLQEQRSVEKERVAKENPIWIYAILSFFGFGFLCALIIAILSACRSASPARTAQPSESTGRRQPKSTGRPYGSEYWPALRRHRDATPHDVNLLGAAMAICDGRTPPGSTVPTVVPPLAPGRTITSAGGFTVGRCTASGEIQTHLGTPVGRIDPKTGDVRTPSGLKVGNVKGISNPDKAAAEAQRRLDDWDC